MENIEDWAVKLAEAAAPDEVGLAPYTVEAYLEGGEARAELFEQTDTSIAGGFGPGGVVALLPWILNGIAAAARWIAAFLAADETSNAVSVLSGVKELLAGDKREAAEEQLQNLPSTDSYQALKHIIETFRAELIKAGIPQDQADLITFRALIALLENPQETAVVVEQLQVRS